MEYAEQFAPMVRGPVKMVIHTEEAEMVAIERRVNRGVAYLLMGDKWAENQQEIAKSVRLMIARMCRADV